MGLLWDFFGKSKDQKLKEAFDKIKKDIKSLELKLNSFLFEKEYLSNQIKNVSNAFNSLLEHYKNAIIQYNNLHSNHKTQIQAMEQELVQIKQLLKKIVKKLNETQEVQKNLSLKIDKSFQLYEELNKKIRSFNIKQEHVRNKSETHHDIELSDSEKKILAILQSLKNEFGNNIPVGVLLDEIYKGDRRKASTLSNYLNRLEQKGLIKRERKGRLSYVLIKS